MPRPREFFAFAALALQLGAVACPADAGECQAPGDCAAPEEAPCPNCAAPSAELCVEGACEARPDDEVDLSGTFLVARAVDGVNGLAFAITPDAACQALTTAFPEELNVLLSGQRTLTGGDLHPDVGLGRAPGGTLSLSALATAEVAGGGAVLARGCVTFESVAPSTSAPQLTLEP